MSAQHTPGPWTLIGQNQVCVCAPVVGGSMAPVCTAVEVGGMRSSDEAQANARLIAAAPDMLAKLEAWQAVCDRITEQYGGVVAGVDFGALGRSNRATIAKATGQEGGAA